MPKLSEHIDVGYSKCLLHVIKLHLTSNSCGSNAVYIVPSKKH